MQRVGVMLAVVALSRTTQTQQSGETQTIAKWLEGYDAAFVADIAAVRH